MAQFLHWYHHKVGFIAANSIQYSILNGAKEHAMVAYVILYLIRDAISSVAN